LILIYGRLDDPPLKRTVDALEEASTDFVLLDQTRLDREELRIEVDSTGVHGTLVVAGQELPLDRVHSVYTRPLELPHRVCERDGSGARLLHEQLLEWLDIAPALVVNRPRAMYANGSKPLQIQLIGEAGFLVPETLVTSDEAEVRAFQRQHGRIVYKSSSGVRSIVQELDDRASEKLGRLAMLPVQFQEFIPGVDVRIHVVGSRCFAAEIRSSGIDYRYAGLHGKETTLTATELAPELAARCVAMSQQMALPLSGIDLRRRPDGVYVCFEVNPMPAYSYFEAHTGLQIGRALSDLLIAGHT
jgi:glutathione synthase/RimK-type ligase-like ATP-grasp enzyme